MRWWSFFISKGDSKYEDELGTRFHDYTAIVHLALLWLFLGKLCHLQHDVGITQCYQLHELKQFKIRIKFVNVYVVKMIKKLVSAQTHDRIQTDQNRG